MSRDWEEEVREGLEEKRWKMEGKGESKIGVLKKHFLVVAVYRVIYCPFRSALATILFFSTFSLVSAFFVLL